MRKNRKTRKWAIIIAAVIVLAAIGGVTIMVGRHFVSLHGQHLQQFTYSEGGGMNGGYYRKSVKRADDTHALISIEEADWYAQDPTVREYLVDASILEELEAVVRKCGMNFWNRKTFTRMFIADGESKGYSFQFDKASVDFSSQYYPARFRKKLSRLNDIINPYLQDAAQLPGLVNRQPETEESVGLPEGKAELAVYFYCGDELGVRIKNGTEEKLELPGSWKVVDADTGRAVAQQEEKYGKTVYPQSRDEMSFRLPERLSAGNYTLVLGEWELPFEIR